MAGDFIGECENARTVLELSENQLELMVGAALVEADGSGLEVRCGIVEEILSDGSVLSHHLLSPLVIEISCDVRLWTSAPGLASECIDAVQGNDHLEMAIAATEWQARNIDPKKKAGGGLSARGACSKSR